MVVLSDSPVNEEGGFCTLLVLLQERVVPLPDSQGSGQAHAPGLALPLLAQHLEFPSRPNRLEGIAAAAAAAIAFVAFGLYFHGYAFGTRFLALLLLLIRIGAVAIAAAF